MEMIRKLFKDNSFIYFAKNWKKANWSIVFSWSKIFFFFFVNK